MHPPSALTSLSTMALDAGVMSVTLEFAKDLKDADWFGK